LFKHSDVIDQQDFPKSAKFDKNDDRFLKKRSLADFLLGFDRFLDSRQDYDYFDSQKKTNDLFDNTVIRNPDTKIEGKDINTLKPIIQRPKVKNVADITSYLAENDITNTDFTFFKYNKMLNFSFIDLDFNFADFFEKNLYKTCELCHQFPWGETMAIC